MAAPQYVQIIGGVTSALLRVFIGSSTTGTFAFGVSGITAGVANLTASWIRDGGTGPTPLPLVAGVTGTWSSGGFIQVDAATMRGVYEIGLPNALITAGVAKATLMVIGAAGMADTPVAIDFLTGDPYAALVTNTYAQPSAAPPATDTLANKIGWMAALSRNQIQTSATTQTLYQDGGITTISNAAVSDNGTVAVRGKWS